MFLFVIFKLAVCNDGRFLESSSFGDVLCIPVTTISEPHPQNSTSYDS